MQVKFNVLDRQFFKFQKEYEQKAVDVLRSGWYVLGNEVATFEKEFATYTSAKYCVGLASGLDALWLSFKILGIDSGDEVIVPANTYIASVMGITINGATPVFVEPDKYYNLNVSKIKEKITNKTKAILPVHLYGQPCQMDKLRDLCDEYNLYLIEDCAQSHGAKVNSLDTSNYADISCYSFYPSKNLGAFGDGGAITTNNEKFAELFRIYRNYGSQKRYHNMVVGANSRLDEIQAGFLRVKLKYIDELNDERKKLANNYIKKIENPLISLPKLRDNMESVWHLFVISIKNRDKFMEYLKQEGIETLIHYPVPPHLAEAYEDLGYKEGAFPITEDYAKTILSLPLYCGMTMQEQEYVIEKINAYREN